MVSNMATFDIEKYKMNREKEYYKLVAKIGKSTLEDLKIGNNYYENLIKILNINWIRFNG